MSEFVGTNRVAAFSSPTLQTISASQAHVSQMPAKKNLPLETRRVFTPTYRVKEIIPG
jgi:hypothetical protein